MIRLILAGLLLVAVPSFAQTPAYTLNPGDVLKISSYDDERLDREVVVLPDGMISYPVVGEIKAAGITVNELQQQITQALIQKGMLKEGAIVDASVIKTNGYTVYVIGQVKQPGAYSAFARIDVLQALSLAGGLTPFASESNITIVRNRGERQEVFHFDYGAVEDGEAAEQTLILEPGDTVVVPN